LVNVIDVQETDADRLVIGGKTRRRGEKQAGNANELAQYQASVWLHESLLLGKKRLDYQIRQERLPRHVVTQEWWRFTLDKEPYPETYFDFPIQ
jgi:hypothetical protein